MTKWDILSFGQVTELTGVFVWSWSKCRLTRIVKRLVTKAYGRRDALSRVCIAPLQYLTPVAFSLTSLFKDVLCKHSLLEIFSEIQYIHRLASSFLILA